MQLETLNHVATLPIHSFCLFPPRLFGGTFAVAFVSVYRVDGLWSNHL